LKWRHFNWDMRYDLPCTKYNFFVSHNDMNNKFEQHSAMIMILSGKKFRGGNL